MPLKLSLYELNRLHQGILTLVPIRPIPIPLFPGRDSGYEDQVLSKDDKIFLICQSILRTMHTECKNQGAEFLG